ncbi:fructose PTS transporter subunit IIB [uncultured Cohaesibacter sp.]|uniref:fructose PTS transporter subunit IIB n=1 Tax=uncultured Cohaesibacter sp. TaxID=1002546 RepID=UPI00292F7413|nr:fructose PTS transporter subunit IIB [uncultured Cohaesibacter sp.]
MTTKPLVLAITGCISGVAHTYMAAEVIENLCRELGYKVSVETQGALGIENAHGPDLIEKADLVIFAADVTVAERERFVGLRIIDTDIQTVLKSPEKVREAIVRILYLQNGFVMQI